MKVIFKIYAPKLVGLGGLLKASHLHGCFSHFLNRTSSIKSCNASHIYQYPGNKKNKKMLRKLNCIEMSPWKGLPGFFLPVNSISNSFQKCMLHCTKNEVFYISSVNMTKSVVCCWFGHIYWRNPQWKTSFLCDVDNLILYFHLWYSVLQNKNRYQWQGKRRLHFQR